MRSLINIATHIVRVVTEAVVEEPLIDQTNNQQEVAVGIDLGTTNSCISIVNKTGEDSLTILTNSAGKETLPSVVYVDVDDNNNLKFTVGEDALVKQSTATIGNRFFHSCKRLLGYSSFKDDNLYNKINNKISYNIVQGKDKESKKDYIYMPVRDANGKEIYQLKPVEVSAQVVGAMKSILDNENVSPKAIYVTVPAYFAENQKEATKFACKIAGLEITGTVAEPVAAAMAYKVKNAKYQSDSNSTFLVCDVGGGTTDNSCVASGQKGYTEVLAYSGNNFLGGDNINQCLYKHFHDILKSKGNTLKSSVDKYRLESFAEQFKIEMCKKQNRKRNLKATISKTFIIPKSEKRSEEFKFEFKMSAQEFDDVCQEFFDAFEETLTGNDGIIKKLANSNRTVHDIDTVILVGGSTRVPKIREIIKKHFSDNGGAEIDQSLNPDTCVAEGAGLYAAETIGYLTEEAGIVFVDITNLPLGIKVNNDEFITIIDQGTPLPAKLTKTFTTSHDNQRMVVVDVAQGPYHQFRLNKAIGKLEFPIKKSMAQGEPQIEVTLSISRQNEIEVNVHETVTDHKDVVKFTKQDASMTQEAIDKMKENYEKHKDADNAFHELAEAKNNITAAITQAKKSIQSLTGEQKDNATNVVNTLDSWFKVNKDSTNKEELEKKLKEFNDDLEKVMGHKQADTEGEPEDEEEPLEVGKEDL